MRRITPLFALLILVAAGCGSAENTTSTNDPSAPSSSAGPSTTAYPLTIQNCGFTHTYEKAPKRVVTMNQNVTEIAFALGIADRMVGTAGLQTEILPTYKAEYDAIPVLGRFDVSPEKILETNPDFIYAGLTGSFGKDPVAARERYEELGIATFQATEVCAENPGSEAPELTLNVLYNDIATLGKIFDVQDRATALSEDIRTTVQQIADATQDVDTVKVASLYTFANALTAHGRAGTGHLLIELAGGEDVFADRPVRNGEISAEAIAGRDPEAILVSYLPPTTAKQRIAEIEAVPGIADVRAVANKRYYTIDGADLALGIRTADTAQGLAMFLYPDAFAAS